MNQDDIIVLKKFDSPIKANIARAKLDAYGIPCFLTEEHLTQLINSVLSGGIRLHVFASDKDTATEVLENDFLSKSDDEQMLECPDCRSKKILGNGTDGIHKQMSKAITDAFLGISKPFYCLDCGKEFDV